MPSWREQKDVGSPASRAADWSAGRSRSGHQAQDEQDLRVTRSFRDREGETFCRTSPALPLAIPAPELSEHPRAQKKTTPSRRKTPIRTYARQYRAEMTTQN